MDPSLTGIGDFLIGCLLAVIGTVALALARLRRKGSEPLLGSFGIFILLFGIRLVFDSPLILRLGVSGVESAWVTSVLTYLVNVPASFFFWQLLGRPSGLLYAYIWLFSGFALVGLATDIARREPGTLSGSPNNLLVVVWVVILAVQITRRRASLGADRAPLVAGLSILGLFVVNENLVSMGVLPWSWSEESIGILLFSCCLGFIAARQLFLRETELRAIESELETARKIQASILPAGSPRAPGLAIASRFHPASAVAGDFYDFLERNDGGVGVLVADVSGHGVPAALIASMVKVAANAHRESSGQPSELISKVNRALCGSFQRGFVTAAYLYFPTGRREVVAAVAGHPPPLHWRAATAEVGEVGGLGPILGRFNTAEYSESVHPLASGDRLVLFSDGILEALDPKQEMFGEERLRDYLSAHGAEGLDDFCDGLVRAVREWQGLGPGEPFDDDLTLVVVEVTDSGNC